jgi:hypothetical protein
MNRLDSLRSVVIIDFIGGFKIGSLWGEPFKNPLETGF